MPSDPLAMNTNATPADGDASSARETAAGHGRALAVLKARKLEPFLGRHPWVFDTALDRLEGECDDGDVVDLVSDKRRFVARGLINPHSKLRIRLYTWDAHEPLDDAFWSGRIRRAMDLRARMGYDAPAGAARLIFSEADGLSGLIVDRYGPHLVVQINALAIARRADRLLELLADAVKPASITVRTETGIAKAEGMHVQQGLRSGRLPDGPVFIEEHGLRFGVDLLTGQKTGFYLDQRENRLAAARYLRGRRVLDMFCYSGGFSLTAASLGGAHDVLGIDASEHALALARANAALNGIPNVRFEPADCFDRLDALQAEGARFGAIILDPPKFTRSKQSLNDALRAYHRINRVAVELLEPDGILVTCSCSGSVSREDFLKMLAVVAQKTGRSLQVLEQRGPSPDHPINPACPENEYLKCFICRVA